MNPTYSDKERFYQLTETGRSILKSKGLKNPGAAGIELNLTQFIKFSALVKPFKNEKDLNEAEQKFESNYNQLQGMFNDGKKNSLILEMRNELHHIIKQLDRHYKGKNLSDVDKLKTEKRHLQYTEIETNINKVLFPKIKDDAIPSKGKEKSKESDERNPSDDELDAQQQARLKALRDAC